MSQEEVFQLITQNIDIAQLNKKAKAKFTTFAYSSLLLELHKQGDYITLPWDSISNVKQNGMYIRANRELITDYKTFEYPDYKRAESVYSNLVLSKQQKAAGERAKLAYSGFQDFQEPLSKTAIDYLDTTTCASQLITDDYAVRAQHYCHKRHCVVCNRIRSAQLHHSYFPSVKQLPDKFAVTLTLPNCSAFDLKDQIEHTVKVFRKVLDTINKRIKRNKLEPLAGLRKLECTYNPIREDYHPHLHVLVNRKDYAEQIVEAWLSEFQDASINAQLIQTADNRYCFELFKYFTKIVAGTSKVATQSKNTIFLKELDVIFRSMQGQRIFQPFGTIKALKEPDKPKMKHAIGENEYYVHWHQQLATWVLEDGLNAPREIASEFVSWAEVVGKTYLRVLKWA